MNKFDIAFEHLMANEGGYSDDPVDVGGRTIYGIASKYHREWFNVVYNAYKNIGVEAAKKLAKGFYRAKFWNDNYDAIEDTSIAFRLFDFGVNAGVGTSVKILQECVNYINRRKVLTVDGVFGLHTLTGCNMLIQESLYLLFTIKIYLFYLKRPTAWKHLRGWTLRLLKRYWLKEMI